MLLPAQLSAVDDDGDVGELRLASTHGTTRVYAAFDAVGGGGRRFLLLDPVASAPAWDTPVTLDVFPIDEPWTIDGGEPRVGVRAFSVTVLSWVGLARGLRQVPEHVRRSNLVADGQPDVGMDLPSAAE